MYPFDRVAVYKLADILLTLSSSEETFYTLCGVNARYVPNPSADIIKSDIIPIKQRNLSVLWIGRLSNEKNYKEALKIFKIIVDKYVNVKCYIVGSGGIRDNIFVDFFIKFNNLNDNIIHIPYTKDVEVFYKKTYVQLVTSSFESFPMVIVEGKLYGLPLVTYDLPTVELLKDERGIVRVESHNIQEAADAVLTILKNKEYAERLSNEARESIESFFQCDQEKIWSEIFKDPCKKYIKIGEKDTENMSLFWSSLITMYHEGLVSKPSVRQQIKTLIKCILEIFFPVGSQRRRITKNVYRSTKRYLKAKCRDVVNNLGTNKK